LPRSILFLRGPHDEGVKPTRSFPAGFSREDVETGHLARKGERKGGPPMSVITVSKQLGSLGTEIARAAADRLGYQYIDKERIEKALANYGVPVPAIEEFDEKTPPFWDFHRLQRRWFIHSLEAAIYEFARSGNAVIVGRGGQILLRELPGILNVRIRAPWGVRLKRIMTLEGGDEKKAARLLHRSDHDSAGFLRTFFDVNWEDSDLYDLIINTAKLSLESGAQAIVDSLSSAKIREGGKEIQEKLADLALAQKAEVSLMRILEIGFGDVNVQVKGGVVSLSGYVASETLKENSLQALALIEGVNRIDSSQLYVQTQYYAP